MTTNDPDRHSLSLAIKGVVIRLLQVKPSSLSFKDVFKGETRTLPINLIPWEGRKFDIVDVESSAPEFEVHVLPASGIGHFLKDAFESARESIAGKFGTQNAAANTTPEPETPRPAEPETDMKDARTINVTLLPTAPIGRHHTTIKIHTTMEEKPLVEVRVNAQVIGNVKVEPKHYNFGNVKRDESKDAIFKVTTGGEGTVRITGVVTSPEHVTAEILDTMSGSTYELKISVGPDLPLGKMYGTATLQTTDEDQPEVMVKFYANVVE